MSFAKRNFQCQQNRLLTKKKALAAQPLIAKIEQLETKHKSLKSELTSLLKERRAMRAELKPFIWGDGCDMGCDCDDNHCVSPDFSNQPLASGQTKTFIHDDQDTSDFTVVCNVGKVVAILSVSPWSTWHEIRKKNFGCWTELERYSRTIRPWI